MAYIIADRIKETTTVAGTGAASTLGAVSGYRTFASQLSVGDTFPYAIVNATGTEWEVGLGTYSAVNTITRTTVHSSTNANALVSFSAGTKDVFVGPTAETLVSDVTSIDGTVTIAKSGSVADLSVAVAAAATNVIVQVRNTTGATLSKGTAVYLNGTVGQIPTVAKALATSDATSAQTLGLISADLANNSNGYVTIIGLISDINTSAFTDGQQLYLSGTIAGGLTATKPYAPTHLVYVAVVEHAHPTQGKLFVKVQNGYELDELHDVAAQSPTNGQTIVFNSSNSLWEKNTVSLTNGVNGTLPVVNGGTGVTTSTGTGSVVLSNAPTLTTATLAAGTITTSTPNTITQTWNASGTTFSALTVNVTDTASASGSLLADLQVGGSSKFKISKAGLTTVSGSIYPATSGGANLGTYGQGFSVLRVRQVIVESGSGTTGFMLNQSIGIVSASLGLIGFSSATADSGLIDTTLYRDAADTLAQRRTTNAQTFRVYNTYTDASNYERLVMGWSGNVGTIGLERGGTGGSRNIELSLGYHANGFTGIKGASGSQVQVFCVGSVPAAFTNSSVNFNNAVSQGSVFALNFGQNDGGWVNRAGNIYVLRPLGGSGVTATSYIGFGATYVPAGATSTTAHTSEDCFLVKLLASATPIVAFGSSFASTVPALKRSGTTLQARLADDSGDATIQGKHNIVSQTAPASATDTGTTGEIRWDANYIYVCTATNTWKRSAIATW